MENADVVNQQFVEIKTNTEVKHERFEAFEENDGRNEAIENTSQIDKMVSVNYEAFVWPYF